MRSGKLSPAILASSAIAQQFPSDCPELVDELLWQPGTIPTNIGRRGPLFGRCGPNLAKDWQGSVKCCPKSAKCGRALPNVGQDRPTCCPHRPMLVGFALITGCPNNSSTSAEQPFGNCAGHVANECRLSAYNLIPSATNGLCPAAAIAILECGPLRRFGMAKMASRAHGSGETLHLLEVRAPADPKAL